MRIIEIFLNPIEMINGVTPTFAEGFLSALAFVLAILTALVLHEIAHGYIAYKNGDNTAKSLGRLSLNPLKHLDLFGTIMMLFVGFGWAKPVPINPTQFRNYKKGCFTVAIAGVTLNIILAFLMAGLYSILYSIASENINSLMDSRILYYIVYFLYSYLPFGVTLNVCLFLFNLLPIFPLDGFRVFETFLKPNNRFLLFSRRYSYYILLGLIALGYFARSIGFEYLDVFGLYINTFSNWIQSLFYGFWGLLF